MIFLIVTVVIGIAFAFFATQNTTNVPVQLGNIQFTNVPLYALALGSLLLGLAVSGILRMIDWAATGLTLRGKDNEIRQRESTVEKLQQKVRDLELENSRLKEKQTSTPITRPTFLSKDRPEQQSPLQRLHKTISG